jgi:hypothetical protein
MLRTKDTRDRRQRRARSERGQVVALYALALPAVLAMLALALDGGKLFVVRLHLQNAVDASSLAAVQDVGPVVALPVLAQPAEAGLRRPQVEQDVNCYAFMNHAPVGTCDASLTPQPIQPCVGYWGDEDSAQRSADSNCYVWPYRKTAADSPDYSKLEVRLRKAVSLDFGGLPGIPSQAHPWARSVATFNPDFIPGSPGSPATTDTFTDPDQIVPDTTVTSTTVIDDTTYTTTTVIPGDTHTNTTVIPGAVHTVTNLTGGGSGGGVAWAASTACPAISWTGSQTGSLGDFGTNGGFFSNGATPKTMDYLAVGKKGTAGCFDNNAPVTITKPVVGPFSPQPFPIPPPSIPIAVPLGGPRGPNECWDLGAGGTFQANASHPSGVYCVTDPAGTLGINSDLTVGGRTYTFFAPNISVSGGNVKSYAGLPVGQPPTVLYSSGNITIQGSGSNITGDIFAPNGMVSIQGSGVQGGSGFIECQTLKIAGNFASYTGTGPFGGGGTTVTTITDPDTTVYSTTTDPSTTNFSTSTKTGTTSTTETPIPGTTSTGLTHTVITPSTPSTPGSTATTGTVGLGE